LKTRIRQVKWIFCTQDFQNQFWTVIAIGAFSLFPTLLVFLVTRQVGLMHAGTLVFAFALSELPVTLTAFAIRPFQSVDVIQEIHFNAYFGLRTICALCASIGYAIYLLIADFDTKQLVVIILIYFMALTNIYTDVFMGDLQQKGKMHVAGKMQASCYIAALLASLTVLIVTSSLIATLVVACLVIFVGYILWIWIYRKHFGAIRVKIDFHAIKRLMIRAVPLVIAGFIMAFLVNAQKFYLEAYFSAEYVAVYGFLLIPVGLFNIICTGFFSGSISTKTAEVWAFGDVKRFKRRVNLQLLTAVGLFIPFLLCVYFFGIPLLSWILATDLSPFRVQLMLLSFGGMTRAPLYVINPMLIVFLKQRVILVCILVVAVTIGPLMWWLVSQYGLSGAAYSTIVLYAPFSVVCYVIYRIALKKHEKESV